MLDFRLDADRRQAITERTLAEHRVGVPGPLIEEIAATLESGATIFVVLHTGAASTAHEDAVARCGGADRRRAGRCHGARAGRPAAAPSRRVGRSG
jgi:hypothetical protein